MTSRPGEDLLVFPRRSDAQNSSSESFYVDEWLVEPPLNTISRDGTTEHLEPKTMAALVFLAERQGRVVGREELYASVWGATFVTDNTLTRTVSRLRRALQDDWQNPRYLETISKSGYRLIAQVRAADSAARTEEVEVFGFARRKWWTRASLALATVAFVATTSAYLANFPAPDSARTGLDPAPVLTLVGPQGASKLSPDGTRIAFGWTGESEENWDIYIKMLGSENLLRLTTSESRESYPAWSGDGRSIAFIRVEGERAGIFRVASIGGAAMRIGDCSPNARHLAWSPSGHTLAFSDVTATDGIRQLFALDPAAESVRPLTSATGSAAGDSHPAFSPDGRQLAFVRGTSLRRDDLMVLSLEDSKETLLANEGDVRGHDWAPDGKSVIYSSNRAGQFALWRLSMDGGEPERLPVHDQWVTEPSVAREKNRLIYRKFSDVIDLWSFDLGDDFELAGDRQRIAPSTRSEFLPVMSGDGSRVGFVSNRSGELELWSTDLESGELIRHTDLNGPVPGGITWSPDGRSVVYDAPTAGNLDLYAVDYDSRSSRALTFEPSEELNASFSRDGTALYFASNRSGRFEIWKKAWPGDEAPARRVTTSGGFFAREDAGGEYLYYAKPDGSLWKRPLGGEAEESVGVLHPYDWASWTLVPDGAVFVTRGPTAIRHLRFEDEAMTVIHEPAKQMPYLGSPFALATDFKRIVVAEIAHSDDEVMLVEWQEDR